MMEKFGKKKFHGRKGHAAGYPAGGIEFFGGGHGGTGKIFLYA